ncbi:TLD-domain-containing protein, partial [Powellomyces hirtus]
FPDLASFETWFQQNRYLQNLWKVLFQFAFFGRLPEFPSMVGGSSSLLMIEDRYVLHTSLPSEFKSEKTWFRLFTGDQNGKSWTVFMGKVVEAGSILFVFRDKDDHIFGAFAAADLKTGPNFFGNSSSFLYSLRPRMGIYQSTGYNSNYQYMNHGAATYPNGLGFGGQLDYFGLWISSSFEGGHSKASPRSTTFDSPRLSNKEEFTLDYCEAWLIKPKEVDDRLIDPKQAKKSVLDDDITSSLLEMSGRRMYSKEVGRNDEPSNNEPAG